MTIPTFEEWLQQNAEPDYFVRVMTTWNLRAEMLERYTHEMLHHVATGGAPATPLAGGGPGEED